MDFKLHLEQVSIGALNASLLKVDDNSIYLSSLSNTSYVGFNSQINFYSEVSIQ